MHTAAQHNYILGHSSAEHDRLVRQGALLDAYTERLFRTAGILPGMNVLDVGCGVGDVSFLTARLVGTKGQVVGIDQDLSAVSMARQRAMQAGFKHVRFEQAAANEVRFDNLFDAVVGRFVLMFVPDPVSAVTRLRRNLRHGGLLIFQEPSWSVFFALSAALPLHHACGRWLCEALRSGGANPDMGLELYQIFDCLGDGPAMRMEVPAIAANQSADWMVDLMTTLRRESVSPILSAEIEIGFSELPARLASEARQTLRWRPMPALVGAWARKGQSSGGYDVQQSLS